MTRPLQQAAAAHTPGWFRAALAQQPERSTVLVEGTEIETLAWGRRGDPGLLLVHGHNAHADWWSFIGPLLAEGYRVAAFSLSGMGNSGWRDHYAIPLFAQEAIAAARATGLFESAAPPVLLGHSFGGLVVLSAVTAFRSSMGGAIILDCLIDDARFADTPVAPLRTPRTWSSRQELLSRFRLLPAQSCANDFILDFIAEHAIRQVSSGEGDAWMWKADPNIRRGLARHPMAPVLSGVTCPLAILRGDRSGLLDAKALATLIESAPDGTPFVDIVDSDHHVPIDQPLALIAAVRAIMALWSKSPPRGGVEGASFMRCQG